ncbi:MAG: hypothetical protein OQJ89_08570, partial [Kangiellaceae bacterium]|nr:hypothetical protein [Kangiellaceae bacterium]
MNSTEETTVDAVLDAAPVEEQAPATSIEAELPTSEGGIESEVAPMPEKTDDKPEATAKEVVEKVSAEAAKVKAETEAKVEEAKKKTDTKDDPEN